MPVPAAPRIGGLLTAAALIVSGGMTALAQEEVLVAGERTSATGILPSLGIDLERWLRVDLELGPSRGRHERVPPKLRLMLRDGTGLVVVTDPGGDAPSLDAAVLPRSDRLAQQEVARHSDAEIGLAIGIAKGVDLVPAYGLHWTGNEAEGIEADVSHRFTFGARIGF
jgi:hypothetical protein